MDAILFIHHKGLRDRVTRKHHALLRDLNPGCEVIPLSFDTHSPDTYQWQRENHDVLMYEWFAKEKKQYDHYWMVEWDTLCTQSLRHFFGDSYHKKAVASMVVRPWSNDILPTDIPGYAQRQRDWYWFEGCQSPELHPFLRGMVPASCVMFSHECLFNMVELWKTVPAFKHLQGECRLGTLAAMAGFEPQEIRPDCHKWISAQDVDIDQGPGCYHRCRV
jgi:hypothetical protein